MVTAFIDMSVGSQQHIERKRKENTEKGRKGGKEEELVDLIKRCGLVKISFVLLPPFCVSPK